MCKITCSFFVVLVLFLYSRASSQTVQKLTNPNAATQCKWTGTIHSSMTFIGTQTITGTVTFEFVRNTALGIEYKLAGGHVSWAASGTYGGTCPVTGGPMEFDVSADSGDWGSLTVYVRGGYAGSGRFAKLNTTNRLVTVTCPEGTTTYPPDVNGFSLDDTSSLIVDDMLAGSTSGSNVIQSWFYSWDMRLQGVDTKLSVESLSSVDRVTYDDWLPNAGRDEKTPGNSLTIQAQLIEADGSAACARADSFKFELINVSNEKGMALNYPDSTKAQEDFDLHFDYAFIGPRDVMSADKLTLITEKGKQAIAQLFSYDWGAYGTLRVSAYMHYGKVIVGFLKGHTEITDITIPRRSNGSKIADKWKADHGVSGLDDLDDSEKDPIGDGDAGDGFPLYEEYRGFYENGRHIFGDPKRKDLFVFSAHQEFYPGIQLLARVTGLSIHYRLRGNEFDAANRVMNINRGSAPHLGFQQHALRIVRATAGASRSPIGPPKYADTTRISPQAYGFTTMTVGRRKEITNELHSTVAHELGHAVRIEHHGSTDKKKAVYTSKKRDNPITGRPEYEVKEDGIVVDPRYENDRPYPHEIKDTNYVGVWGGLHSGEDDCIMRYDVAFAYIPGPGTGSNIRYIIDGNERTGLALCDKQQDHPGGLNDVNRHPRPRYQNATVGNCKSQICVNDKYH